MIDVDGLPLLGGHLALDFVNTVEDRASSHPQDTLRSGTDLRRWGVRLGLLSDRNREGTTRAAEAAEVARAVSVREDLHQLLDATVRHAPAPEPAVTRVARVYATAYRQGVLRSDGATLAWAWSPRALSTVRFTVVVTAVALLSDARASTRIRRCDAAGCGWFFLDSTKNASRRWCSMGGCGTLAKTQRRATTRRAGRSAAALV